MIKGYTYDDDGHPLTMFYKGITYYYLTNYRGDVLAMTDESGKVVASYTYDAWGSILTQSGEMAEINPYRYAGYRYDDDTKLYYLMARYYDPENGVFLSQDPVSGDLKNPITLNGYNYANNNPMMNVDPDGTISIPASLKSLLRSFIKLIFNDFISNTATNLVLILTGGGVGGWTARKLAMKGFTMLNRGVAKKMIKGFITGGLGNYVLGKWSINILGIVQYWVSKASNYEKKFDQTFLGKSIDIALRKTRDYLLGRI